MNPSRTHTPRGAVGIAGLVAAIYPIESPGGYQLYGRTLSVWQTWGKGKNFAPDQPWLLRPFDQVTFEVVAEDEYVELEAQFDAGRYEFKIEPTVLSMSEHNSFISSIADEVKRFQEKQAIAVATEEAHEHELLAKWDEERRRDAESRKHDVVQEEESAGAATVVSSLSASVWKIQCRPGDVVKSGEDVLIVLEAMKTEVNVEAGDENVGRKVAGFGKGVKEGTAVNAGDVLVVFS